MSRRLSGAGQLRTQLISPKSPSDTQLEITYDIPQISSGRLRRHRLSRPPGSLAIPFPAAKTAAAGAILAGYQESEDDDHKEEHRLRHDDNGRYAADDCEDEDDDACDRGGALQQQNATPPSNGLFTPGSKPRAQTN
jgi:hypothetical protein